MLMPVYGQEDSSEKTQAIQDISQALAMYNQLGSVESQVNLVEAFERVNEFEIDFIGLKIPQLNLERVELSGSNWPQSQLMFANFSNSNFIGTEFIDDSVFI